MKQLFKTKEILSKDAMKLDRIRAALKQVGHPELGRKTILVAGTNGKGSVCAMLTRAFCEKKIRVGTFISPHLVHRTERIRIDFEPVSEALLRRYEKRYQKQMAPLTFFERFTFLAFVIFRDLKVDVQVIEVGLGGRLDATNVCEPDLSIVSRIDYDHQDILGSTLTQIAKEKAGIMRPLRPVVISSQVREAKTALFKAADKIGAMILKPQRQHVLARVIHKRRGSHQRDNAASVLAAMDFVSKHWGYRFTNAQLKRALLKPLFEARQQILRERPLMVVDGAHNPNSIQSLVRFLKQKKVRKEFHLVYGCVRDKPIEMMRPLFQFTKRISFVSFYPEREYAPETLARAVPSRIPVSVLKSLDDLELGREPTLVAGSLYLAGAFLNWFRTRRSF